MFDPGSRYAPLPIATLTDAEGRPIAYVTRRFLPQGASLPLAVEARVEQGDRLDLIAARTLGDPEHFWRICDANDALDPWALTAEPGRRLRVPVPQP
jgi:hypothetical protein